MTRLLFHADPSCEDGRFAIETHVGDCVGVYRDDFEEFTDLVKKHYLIVHTDKSYEDCVALFKASGIPDDVQKASEDEKERFIAAMLKYQKDLANWDSRDIFTEPVKPVLDNSLIVKPTDYPHRRVKIDITQFDVQNIRDFKTAIDAKRVEAYEAKEAFLAATAEEMGLSSTEVKKLLNLDLKAQTPLAISEKDLKIDQLRQAEKIGWDHVMEPIEQSFEPTKPVVVDSVNLDTLVITK